MTARPLTLAEFARRQSSIDRLRDLIGEAAVRELAYFAEGRRLYIPKIAEPGHVLCKLLGEQRFALLVAEFGDDRIELPTRWSPAAVRVQVAGMLAAGASVADIALQTGRTRRRVRQIIVELERERRPRAAASGRAEGTKAEGGESR